MLLSRGQFETTLANLEGDVPDPDEVWERFVGRRERMRASMLSASFVA